MTEPTLYDEVGGMPFFDRLVDRFYADVAGDPVLAPLYPDQADVADARRRHALLLVQYWGGPTTHLQERRHPRLRERHSPCSTGALERDRWLVHMRVAIDGSDAPARAKARLHQYVTRRRRRCSTAKRARPQADDAPGRVRCGSTPP